VSAMVPESGEMPTMLSFPPGHHAYGMPSPTLGHLGIQCVPQGITEKIDSHYRDHDSQAGERRNPPGVAHEVSAVREHGAPLRRRRLRAEAEEA